MSEVAHTSLQTGKVLLTPAKLRLGNVPAMERRHAQRLVLFFMYAIHVPAIGMEFEKAGVAVIFGKGPIIKGDADRLKSILPKVKPDYTGMKLLLLDGPGGSVAAAYETAKVIDRAGNIATGVPQGASCASACASILFIAGKVHVVGIGGRIGLHTCFNGMTNEADPLCNHRIAEFALEHGTAYGSLYAFMKYTPSNDITWFTTDDANCYGLDKWPPGKQPPGFEQCIINAIKGLR
jgi:hypothetical protein